MAANCDAILASRALPVEVQLHVARNPHYQDVLARNPGLATDAWFAIYRKGIAVAVAQALVSRRLSTEQVEFVLANEKRFTVLRQLVQYNTLNADQVQRVLNTCHLNLAVEFLSMAYRDLPLALRAGIAKRTQKETRLRFLHDFCQHLDHETCVEWLITSQQWCPGGAASLCDIAQFGDIFAHRPELLTYVTQPGVSASAVLAAAASRHTRDQQLQLALANLVYTDQGWKLQPTRSWLIEHSVLGALTDNPWVTPVTFNAIGHACSAMPPTQVAMLETTLELRECKPFVRAELGQVSDTRELDFLVDRIVPTNRKALTHARDAIALLANPHLGAAQFGRIMGAMKDRSLHWREAELSQALPWVEQAESRHAGAGTYWSDYVRAALAELRAAHRRTREQFSGESQTAYRQLHDRQVAEFINSSHSVALAELNAFGKPVHRDAVVHLLAQGLVTPDGECNIPAWEVALCLVDDLDGDVDFAVQLCISLSS